MQLSADDLSPQRRRLADGLKRLRLNAQFSAEKLGVELGWSQSKVSKIENGVTRPKESDVRLWLQKCGADDATREELTELAAEVSTQATTWRKVNQTGYGAQQRGRAERDAETSGIAIFQSEVVPGLLQTADYARRVLEVHSQAPPGEIAAAVVARLDRQAVLFDESKTIEVVMTETALRWRPGSAAVNLAQLDRIASLATLSTVNIGVIPLVAQAAAKPLHSFFIRRTADGGEVQVETLTAEVEVTAPADVAAYEAFFREQQEHAVYGEELQDLLRRLAEALRNDPGASTTP